MLLWAGLGTHAHCEEQQALRRLALALAKKGYHVWIRTTAPSSPAALKHTFLVVELPSPYPYGYAVRSGEYVLIDPHYKDLLALSGPRTEAYNQLLALLPPVFVGSAAQLESLIKLLCTEVKTVLCVCVWWGGEGLDHAQRMPLPHARQRCGTLTCTSSHLLTPPSCTALIPIFPSSSSRADGQGVCCACKHDTPLAGAGGAVGALARARPLRCRSAHAPRARAPAPPRPHPPQGVVRGDQAVE